MKNNLTEGSIIKNLIYLAWPLIVTMLLQTSFNIIDAIFVGRISSDALAAVSMSFPVFFFVIAISAGIGIGTTVLVARSVGSRRLKQAGNIAEHSLLIGLIISTLLSAFGILFAKQIFSLLGAKEDLMPLVLDYAVIIFYGIVFFVMSFIANSILRGEGNTKIPMWTMLVAVLLNAILDPILIFGYFGFPALGVKGAAIATVITSGIGFFLSFYYIFRGKALVKINFSLFKPNIKIIKDIFKIGIPASLSNMFVSVSLLFITKIVAGFGNDALAAYGIGARLDGFIFMPLVGLTIAAVTLVGQNLGAKQYERAEKTVYTTMYLSMGFAAFVGTFMFLFARILVVLFNSKPEVIIYASSYIKVIALTNIFFAITQAAAAAFLGSGNSLIHFFITLLRTIFLAVPMAYIFSHYMGLIGVWVGIAAATVIASIISFTWFKKGTWKNVKLESFSA